MQVVDLYKILIKSPLFWVLLVVLYPSMVVLTKLAIPKVIGSVTSAINSGEIDARLTALKWLAGLFAGIYVVNLLISIAQTELRMEVNIKVQSRVLDEVLDHHRRDYGRGGKVGQAVIDLYQVPNACEWLLRTTFQILPPIFGIVAVPIALAAAGEKLLASLIAGLVVIIAGLMAIGFTVGMGAASGLHKARTDLGEYLADMIHQLMLVFSSDSEKEAKLEVGDLQAKLRRERRKWNTMVVLMQKVVELIVIGVVFYVLYRIVARPKEEHDNLADAVALFMVVVRSKSSFDQLVWLLSEFRGDSGRVGSTSTSYPPGEGRFVEGVSLGTGVCQFVARGLRVPDKENPDVEPTRVADFATAPIGVTVIYGAVGTGKSTALRTMCGFHPYEGSLTINGTEVRTIKTGELRRAVRFVGQIPSLTIGTVLSNMRVGNPDMTEEEAEAALRKIGGTQAPDIHTQVSRGGEGISGGQRMIVEIARAVSTPGTACLVFDEPTSNMDPEMRVGVVKALTELGKSKTIVVVSHHHALWTKVAKKIEFT